MFKFNATPKKSVIMAVVLLNNITNLLKNKTSYLLYKVTKHAIFVAGLQ